MNEDWTYLGITSPLTIRRIDVAMQEYRLRFEHKQVVVWDSRKEYGQSFAAILTNHII